jgi:hypothetical protein
MVNILQKIPNNKSTVVYLLSNAQYFSYKVTTASFQPISKSSFTYKSTILPHINFERALISNQQVQRYRHKYCIRQQHVTRKYKTHRNFVIIFQKKTVQ